MNVCVHAFVFVLCLVHDGTRHQPQRVVDLVCCALKPDGRMVQVASPSIRRHVKMPIYTQVKKLFPKRDSSVLILS